MLEKAFRWFGQADPVPLSFIRHAGAAGIWRDQLTEDQRQFFVRDIIDVFPGCKLGLSLDNIRTRLARYTGIGHRELLANLSRFLDAVIPASSALGIRPRYPPSVSALGIRLAIHPGDPPFPELGLPSIVSTAEDVTWR